VLFMCLYIILFLQCQQYFSVFFSKCDCSTGLLFQTCSSLMQGPAVGLSNWNLEQDIFTFHMPFLLAQYADR